MTNCIFCRIVAGEIPSNKVFENDDAIIIRDIAPHAALHYLLIPKTHYADIIEFAKKDAAGLARCMKALADCFPQLGLENGCRIISNKGEDGRQSVAHVHIHILGGERLGDKMN